jgi:hypothetical protein
MMEAVLILATIARRFRLAVEPGQSLELLPSITLRPRHPVLMRLKSNNQSKIDAPDHTSEPMNKSPMPQSLIT